MNQKFAENLQTCGMNKDKLIALMADIDAEKRSIKSYLSRLSSEPDGDFGKGRKRQVQIRKFKDKLSFLTEEREAVRVKFGSIKMNKKAMNKAVNNQSVDFVQAFMIAAERKLPEDLFLELELNAAQILSATK